MHAHPPAQDHKGLLFDLLSSLSAEGLWTFGSVEPLLDHLEDER